MIDIRQMRMGIWFALLLLVPILAGLAYFGWAKQRQAGFQEYKAVVQAPLTVRSDILSLYKLSPFKWTSIEFPQSEITNQYVLRIWAAKDQPSSEAHAKCVEFLNHFYADSVNALTMRLSAIELEKMQIEAEMQAKNYEQKYLIQNYKILQTARIEQLGVELHTLAGKHNKLIQSFDNKNSLRSVTLLSFEAVPKMISIFPLVVKSVLVGFAVILLLSLCNYRAALRDEPK
jgi:hypothetical protein